MQDQREENLESFRDGVYTVLVATDVASRGLDIPDVKVRKSNRPTWWSTGWVRVRSYRGFVAHMCTYLAANASDWWDGRSEIVAAAGERLCVSRA